MAIAFDAQSTGSTAAATSLTVAHTCTGSTRILFVAVEGYVSAGSGTYVTGITYNGVAMTLINSGHIISDAHDVLYYLIAPATGTNNIVASFNTTISGAMRATSYTGALQSGVPDASTTSGPTAAQTSITTTVTAVANNCWLVGMYSALAGTWTNGTSTTIRNTTAAMVIADSNGARGTGSQSLNLTIPSTTVFGLMASFAPSAATDTGNFFLVM